MMITGRRAGWRTVTVTKLLETPAPRRAPAALTLSFDSRCQRVAAFASRSQLASARREPAASRPQHHDRRADAAMLS
eukprot:1038970-Rhodomonas_salina.1